MLNDDELEKSSIQMTLPSRKRSSHKCEPIKPAPPVTRIFFFSKIGVSGICFIVAKVNHYVNDTGKYGCQYHWLKKAALPENGPPTPLWCCKYGPGVSCRTRKQQQPLFLRPNPNHQRQNEHRP